MGGCAGVFGQRLEETVLYERRYGVRLVPLVVEQCVAFIRERGLYEVGLFRQSGQASLVKELQEAFDVGERPSFDSSTDVHTVASLLKLYLRQLPEPLVPYRRYQDFLICSQKLSSDRSLGLGELRNLLHELPVANFNLLNFICHNKMSGQNLATVFGPNILRAKAEDPQSIMGAAALVQVLMLELIREHESLFSKIPPSISTRPPGGPHASPSALRHPHLHPSPCLRQLSLPLIAERSHHMNTLGGVDEGGLEAFGVHQTEKVENHWLIKQFRKGKSHFKKGRERSDPNANDIRLHCVSSAAAKSDLSSGQKRLLGHRYTSSHPENCFYPLPSTSQPLQHQADRHDYHQHHAGQGSSTANVQTSSTSLQPQDPLPDSSKSISMLTGWPEAWPRLEEAGSSFWSSGAAEAAKEESAVPEAASGGSSEAQEVSTPSAYDNLDKVLLCQRTENITGGHLENNVAEEEVELEEAGQIGDSSSSWSSCEVLPLDESSDAVGGVSPDMSPKRLSKRTSNLQGPEPQSQPRGAHSLLGELQQQMAQQKAEYQARIHRLERCNDVLERQVAVLRAGLEQQKRSQSVAENKIRKMERAKADADRQNSTLQREMEVFFQMYGEIRRRGRKRERILQSL
ncbi:hypothetical protein PAMA_005778 [Pampus argenteus]